MENKRSFGSFGEEYAAEYLRSIGFEIIARNEYVAHEEIDIIARSDEYLIFAEVKTRRQIQGEPDRYGRPATAVNAAKQAHLLSAASEYIRQHADVKGARKVNIDVIEVYSDPGKRSFAPISINHIRNAVRKDSL